MEGSIYSLEKSGPYFIKKTIDGMKEIKNKII